jgi:putative sterol carrier protein
MASPAELLADLMARFQPSAAEGLDAVYQLVLTGNGGDCWHLVVADRQCQLVAGPATEPDVAITMSVQDWGDLVGGRLDSFSALVSGRLRVDGDMALATRLQALFRLK